MNDIQTWYKKVRFKSDSNIIQMIEKWYKIQKWKEN